MRRLRALPLHLASAAALMVVVLGASKARADVTVFDNDGWSLYTRGLIATHYQLAIGDGDPPPGGGKGTLLGGKFLTSLVETADKKVTLSRMRSGFVGTQLGIGVNRRVSDRVHVESLFAFNADDISSDRAQEGLKQVDLREAWASIVTPYGSLKFGRMFSIFGSASASVVLVAYHYGVGNPCTFAASVIACGSVGAGPLYAGFDSQMRYISPRVAGFELQVSIMDPSRAQSDFTRTPLPRVDGELNYDHTFGPAHLHLIGQGLFDQPTTPTGEKLTAWGAMGTGQLDIGGLTVAGGGWTGKGIGTRVPLESEDPTYPISFDQSHVARAFTGLFGNAAYDFHGTAVAAGGGILSVTPTAVDQDVNTAYSILSQNQEFHVVLSQKIDSVVLVAEFMHWKSLWHYNEVQNINFTGVGVNYFW
jgi:predicted porin